MELFKKHIQDLLRKHTHKDIELEVPPDSKMGDFAYPCFSLSKEHKKNPNEIAKEIASKIKPDEFISEINVLGPYVNFFVNANKVTEQTISKVLKEKDEFGKSDKGKGKKLILEHTSINPNASPHVGRARNAMIGDSLARILKFENYKVEVHYFVNDIGKQIAMLVLGSKNAKKVDFNSLLEIYQKISKEVEENSDKEKEVLALLAKLESGDKDIQEEFKKVVDVAIRGQTGIFKELGIAYDKFDYESSYLFSRKTDKALQLLKKTGRFFFDKDNRVVLDQKGYGLGMEHPFFVLTRQDGTSLYSLRDIAYALDLTEQGEYIVVMGEDHKLYNEQINVALLMLEKPKRKAVHYSFILLDDGKMSTRKGNVVLLEEFMEESLKKAMAELKKRYDVVDEKTAKTIAYGALKYSILKVSPEKNVIFNWDQALSFEGETAPYIQYAYARIASIIRKNNNEIPTKADLSLLKSEEEQSLIKNIALFPQIVQKTGNELRPSVIANYAYDIAKQFNELYHSHQILQEDKKLQDARLLLIIAAQQTIKNALSLLGIDVLEQM